MPNRLSRETSPYLLQHANNPVDWYPWGPEALQKARDEDIPIFLSSGYSSCHWCHVMAHESFEDEAVAALLNQHFVSIKVDREERPDLDQIYMNAVQALTSHGGWPMSVFLTPEGRPFYGGTYFPPTSRHGMPSFTEILTAVVDAWEHRREEVLESGRQLVEVLSRQNDLAGEGETGPEPETLGAALKLLQRGFDGANGGWGSAPKFPQPMVLEFLLRYQHRTGDIQALQMVSTTLQRMARGGIYDHLGGGFHRYSVDAHWLVPHFEKMLYDNAQLARLYLHGWQVTGEPLFRAVAEETLDYVLREMAHPAGGFYSTQDADSEGVEGKFYLWTPEEIRQLLGDEAPSFMAAYGVTDRGNFEGRNILTFGGDTEKREALAPARRRLLEARGGRVAPGRDEKVLTSWNGLMLSALAEAARVLGRQDYRQAAERNADFLLRELRTPEGRLLRSWKEGEARINGYLEDYSHLAEGLIQLYQTTFDPRWYTAARELADTMIDRFAGEGGFYDTADDHEALILRPRDLGDNAVPSGNAMAALVLLQISGLAVEPRYSELAEEAIGRVQQLMEQYPTGFGQWLIAADYALSHPREIAILGDRESADTRALLELCRTGYRPHQVVALGSAGSRELPILEDRDLVDGKAAAYVCVDHTCLPPVTDPEELRAALQGR